MSRKIQSRIPLFCSVIWIVLQNRSTSALTMRTIKHDTADYQHTCAVSIPVGDHLPDEEATKSLLTKQRTYILTTMALPRVSFADDMEEESSAFSKSNEMLLEWSDNFYDDEDDGAILAAFDIDYDIQIERLKRSKWFALMASAIVLIITLCIPDLDGGNISTGLAISGILGVTCIGMWWRESSEEAQIRGVHLAVTKRGVRKDVVDASTNVTTTTTIPFDRMKAVTFRQTLGDEICRASETTRDNGRTPKRCSAQSDRNCSLLGIVEIQFKDRMAKPIEFECIVDVLGFVTVVRDQVKKCERG